MAGPSIPSAAQSMSKVVEVIHEVAQSELPRGTQIGVVIQPPPDLVVKMNNIEITAKDIYISRYLMPNYTRHVVGQTSDAAGGSGDAEYESHHHPIDNDETWTDTLKVGTLVEVTPVYGQDEQLYVIENSVVKL